MGNKAKQFMGAIALTATVGSGAAFADNTVVTSSSASSTGSSSTQTSVIESSNSTLQEVGQSSVSNTSVSSLISNESVAREQEAVGIVPKVSGEIPQSDNGAYSRVFQKGLEPQPIGQASKTTSLHSNHVYGWSAPTMSLYQGNLASTSVELTSVSPSPPVHPAQPDPLGGFIDELSFLAETIVPISFGILWGGAVPYAFGAAALLFSLFVLILVNSRRFSISRYTDLLKSSGFIHAPRSDAPRAFSFATPLKWVLSAPMRV